MLAAPTQSSCLLQKLTSHLTEKVKHGIDLTVRISHNPHTDGIAKINLCLFATCYKNSLIALTYWNNHCIFPLNIASLKFSKIRKKVLKTLSKQLLSYTLLELNPWYLSSMSNLISFLNTTEDRTQIIKIQIIYKNHSTSEIYVKKVCLYQGAQ